MMIIKIGHVSKNEKKIMAKTYHAPLYVRLANVMMTTLLRAGIKVVGFKNYELYLLTVRGRKSGQPRSVPLALLGRNGKRYVACAGAGDWVLNLRAAGEAVLTRERFSEAVTARELPPKEAALVLREEVRHGYPFAHQFGVTIDSSLEEFERAVVGHPIFELKSK
jgi:deazaflavin-dependent oxidoreductase (nitroreductase family)